MVHGCIRTAFVLGNLLLVGCLSEPRPQQLWIDQYRGLRNIPDPTMARNMLSSMCESAAYGGDAAAVVMMLRDLKDEPTRHDELAARCVKHLATQDRPGAERVLKKIENEAIREAAREQAFGKPNHTEQPSARAPASQ